MAQVKVEKARNLKVQDFDASSPAALATAVNTWLRSRTEQKLEAIEFLSDGTSFSAFILYVE